MKDADLIQALKRIKVQTGSLICLGCGHEHNCGVHGCAVIREAAQRLEEYHQGKEHIDPKPSELCGTPMLRCRPERYERYEECGMNENGEILYSKRVMVDEESYAMYCPACGKRLCSRFTSFCPNCGAKMDIGR